MTVLHTQPGVADKFISDVREISEDILKNPPEDVGGSVSEDHALLRLQAAAVLVCAVAQNAESTSYFSCPLLFFLIIFGEMFRSDKYKLFGHLKKKLFFLSKLVFLDILNRSYYSVLLFHFLVSIHVTFTVPLLNIHKHSFQFFL